MFKFNAVKITVSLDGYGKVNEYIRYPAIGKNYPILKMKSSTNKHTFKLSKVVSYNSINIWASYVNGQTAVEYLLVKLIVYAPLI